MAKKRWSMLAVVAAALSGLGNNCTTSSVDVPAAQLGLSVLIMDLDPSPSDGKVPVLVQPLQNGSAVQLAGASSLSCNGVALPWNGLAHAERVPIVATGGTYRIVHTRNGVNTQLVITVPPRPHVTAPSDGQAVTRSNHVQVSYTADGGTSVAAGASDGSTGIAGNDQPDSGTATVDVTALHAGAGTVGVSRKFMTSPTGTGFASVASTFTIGSPDVHVVWQ